MTNVSLAISGIGFVAGIVDALVEQSPSTPTTGVRGVRVSPWVGAGLAGVHGASRRVPLTLVSIAALGAALAACDSLLGLGQYSDVPPQEIPDSSSFDALPNDSTTFDVFEAGAIDATDSGVAVDAAPDAMPLSDAPYDAPPLEALWARWPMPNPDAAIYPGASKLLPNPMAYDAGADGGAMEVLDLVTGLTWWRAPLADDRPSQRLDLPAATSMSQHASSSCRSSTSRSKA